jgi:hypothetical protein
MRQERTADGRRWPAEDAAVCPQDDAEAWVTYETFMKVVVEFPEKDANPRY